MFSGRSGGWQNDADGERGATEQSERHNAGEPRTGTVSVASFTQQGLPSIVCYKPAAVRVVPRGGPRPVLSARDMAP